MSGSLHSGHWFRLAELKPRLRGHARVHRHVYRGHVWYVVTDRISGEHYRFNPAAYEVIRQLDGNRSMQQIWDSLVATLGDDTPSQDDIVRLLGHLNSADLLLLDAAPDVADLLERRATKQRRQWMGRFMNPMSLRLPLWDPDAFLTNLALWIRSPRPSLILLLWATIVVPALVIVPAHWRELTQNFGERLLAANNLWLLILVFPLLKAAHEIAHGLAVKRGGGEVHELGLMFLMFYPVPYVDASAAHTFASKYRRIWVSAAGMAAELCLAALAFYLWLLLEPGLLRSLAYNVVILGSVTTVLFNGNPLLRYDGYFILADWVEIPNLSQRATQYWQHLATRYLFGITSATAPHAAPGERRWFLAYAPLALVYRLMVTLGIAWFVAQQYFIFGVLMAIWAVATGLCLPAYKGLATVFTDSRFIVRPGRVWTVLLGSGGALALILFIIPVPFHTRAQGVIALPERALLRAGTDGFVQTVLATSGQAVKEGDAILESVNPALIASLEQQEAKLEQVQARLDSVWGSKPSEAGRLEDELKREQAALASAQNEVNRLIARPQVAGILLVERLNDLQGRFVHKGEILAYVLGADAPVVKVVVPQESSDYVRLATRQIEVRLPQAFAQAIPGTLARAVPKAGHELPSAALGQSGGGALVIDPRDEKQTTALETVFEFEVALPSETQLSHLGSRAYVSFEHVPEPIGWRWIRHWRRQFLSQLGV